MQKIYPTPEERAEVVIKKLEHIIKSGKDKIAKETSPSNIQALKGISYKKWQDAARIEIANAIVNAILDEIKINKAFIAFLMTLGSCLTTLGFLGAILVWGSPPKLLVAVVGIVIGIVLIVLGVLWFASKNVGDIIADRRKAKIARLNNLNEQVKKMESYLLTKQKSLKNDIDYIKR